MEIKTNNRYFKDYGKKQKIVLLLLMFATVFTCIFSLSYNKMINASARITDDTLTPIFTFAGSGSSLDPYQISSSSDLINLSDSVSRGTSYSGKYFVMTNNIDLGNNKFTPIGINSSYPFNGNFDGNGNKISGINISRSNYPAGLFGYISNATISNLTVSSGSITQTGTSQCAGGIVGWVNGTSRIEKCTNDGVDVFTESASGNTEAGGIVGYIDGSSGQTTTITWCSNYAVVENDSYSTGLTCAGGIVGRQAPSSNYTNISLCKNFGTVRSGRNVIGEGRKNPNSIVSAKYPYSGGIIGYHSKGIIEKACNYGSVYSGKAFSVYQGYDGTYNIRTNTTEEKLIDNDHGAEISYAGGIVGYSNAGINNCLITNCFNKGNVTAKAKSNKMDYKFLLTGIYKINDEDVYHIENYKGRNQWRDSVCTAEELDDGVKSNFGAPYFLDTSSGWGESRTVELLGVCRTNVWYFKDLIEDDFNHMYKYDELAFAYGIGYADSDKSVSNCYNQSTVKGGKQYKKIVFKLRCEYKGVYSDYQQFVFTFNNGGRFGPISNNSCNNVYYGNKFNGVVDKTMSYSINDASAVTMMYDTDYNVSKNADITYKNKTYSQRFYIIKNKNDNSLYFRAVDHRGKDSVEIIYCMKLFSYALFKGESYMTYDDNSGNIKNSIVGIKEDDLKKILTYNNGWDSESVWAQSDTINDGTPYIKEMYWEGVNKK